MTELRVLKPTDVKSLNCPAIFLMERSIGADYFVFFLHIDGDSVWLLDGSTVQARPMDYDSFLQDWSGIAFVPKLYESKINSIARISVYCAIAYLCFEVLVFCVRQNAFATKINSLFNRS